MRTRKRLAADHRSADAPHTSRVQATFICVLARSSILVDRVAESLRFVGSDRMSVNETIVGSVAVRFESWSASHYLAWLYFGSQIDVEVRNASPLTVALKGSTP